MAENKGNWWGKKSKRAPSRPLYIQGRRISISADGQGFEVAPVGERGRCISMGGGGKNAARFYAFAKRYEDALTQWSFQEVLDALKEMGIVYGCVGFRERRTNPRRKVGKSYGVVTEGWSHRGTVHRELHGEHKRWSKAKAQSEGKRLRGRSDIYKATVIRLG